ncbi:MAG: GNAT family N-acetyltransferase [Rhodospirillales bacterium]|nr:GNAT family N-acetyltransferase [Rhodospirillales bacterium]
MSGAARLRQVTAWDAALLATLHAGAFGADAWSETVFAAQFALPGVFALVHEAGGLVLARVAADEAEILTIGVVEAARGQGVGAALLRATFDAVIAAGAVVLFLEVGVRNAAARRFYARAGFIQVGRRRGYYANGEDALVLRADLVPDSTAPP